AERKDRWTIPFGGRVIRFLHLMAGPMTYKRLGGIWMPPMIWRETFPIFPSLSITQAFRQTGAGKAWRDGEKHSMSWLINRMCLSKFRASYCRKKSGWRKKTPRLYWM